MPWTVSSLLLVPLLFSLTLGCGRFPATPKPTTTVETPTTESSIGNSLHLDCTEAEEKSLDCRNNGTCFVLEIGGIRSKQCKCPRGHLPPRCIELDPSVFWTDYQRPDRVRSAGIAASVVAVVLFVTVLVCIVVWRRRYLRKKKNSKPEQNGKNGALINDQDTTDMENKERPPEYEEYPRKDHYRDSVNLSDHFPIHRNSSGPLASAPPPPNRGSSHFDRPNSYNSNNYQEHFPSSDPRSSQYDPFPNIQFVDEDEGLDESGEVLLRNTNYSSTKVT